MRSSQHLAQLGTGIAICIDEVKRNQTTTGDQKMTTYRRSRKDYPKGVLGIYDNGGKTVDRYTVIYTPFTVDGRQYFPFLGMSAYPFHPQGFGQHGELPHRYTRQSGERVLRFADLPADCQRLVLQDIVEAR